MSSFTRAAAWKQPGAEDRTRRDDDRARRDEERVRRDFWDKAKRVAARLPFAEELLAAYYCALDRATPVQVKAMLFAALAYFVMPIDVFPDLMPLIGFTDDAAVLLTALRLISANLRPEHRAAAREALERLRAEQA
jgi:uncharacterized membrane protein YkvA (DUF1232 family)